MPESAPRNELELIDLGEWGRIFGPEQLVQIHERQLGETEMRHVEEGSVRPTRPAVDYWLLSYGDRSIWTPMSTFESGILVTGNVDSCIVSEQYGRRSEPRIADATGVKATSRPSGLLRSPDQARVHGARITSDGGLLAYRELDEALGLTAMAAAAFGEGRRGTNIRHQLGACCAKQCMGGSPATRT
jgi:hypothetical protein